MTNNPQPHTTRLATHHLDEEQRRILELLPDGPPEHVDLDDDWLEYHDDDVGHLPSMPCVAYDFLNPIRRFVCDDRAAMNLASWLGCSFEHCAETGDLPPTSFLDDVMVELLSARTIDDEHLARSHASVVVRLLADYLDMEARHPPTDWYSVEELEEQARSPRMSARGFPPGHPDRPGPVYGAHARSRHPT